MDHAHSETALAACEAAAMAALVDVEAEDADRRHSSSSSSVDAAVRWLEQEAGETEERLQQARTAVVEAAAGPGAQPSAIEVPTPSTCAHLKCR